MGQLGLSSMEKGRPTRDLIYLFKNTQWGLGNEDGARLPSVVPSDRARGNGHQLEHRRFHFKTQITFLPVMKVTVPTEAVEISLEVLKPQVKTVLGNLLQLTLLELGSWTR